MQYPGGPNVNLPGDLQPTQSQPCPHSSPHTPRWSGTQRQSRDLNMALNIAIHKDWSKHRAINIALNMAINIAGQDIM